MQILKKIALKIGELYKLCYIKGKMKKIIFGSLLFILMLSIGFSFIGIPSVSAQISGGDDSNPAVVHLINKVKNGKDSYFNSFVQAGLTSSHYAFRDYKGNQVYNYIIRNMTTDSFSDKNAIVKSYILARRKFSVVGIIIIEKSYIFDFNII